MVTDLGMGFDKWHLFTVPMFQKELRPFSEIQKNVMKSKLGVKGSVCFNSTIYLLLRILSELTTRTIMQFTELV